MQEEWYMAGFGSRILIPIGETIVILVDIVDVVNNTILWGSTVEG